MSLQVVLMGTGSFALPAFRAIIESAHTVSAIVTQPDRTGRGHHRHVNPVRDLGREFGITVLQPARASDREFLATLRDLQPDIVIVAAYGQILKSELLAIPKRGAFNLHGSLLPRHRGAAPVQYAIWKGDRRTGVTMFQIEPSLDSGPVVGMDSIDIAADETTESLMLRLAELCVPLTLRVMGQLEAGTAVFRPQDHSQATLAPRISKSAGQIQWQQTAQEINCHIRAMLPWPKASSILVRPDQSNLRCIFHQVGLAPQSTADDSTGVPGTVSIAEQKLFVQCGDGHLQILRIQPEGSRVLEAADFVNGQSNLQAGSFQS